MRGAGIRFSRRFREKGERMVGAGVGAVEESQPPDVASVREILSESADPTGEGLPPTDFESGSPPEEMVTLVLDPDGRMVASVPEVNGFPETGERLDAEGVPGLAPVLQAARAGEEDPGRLYRRTPDGGYSAAAPVKNEDGRLIGVVVEGPRPSASRGRCCGWSPSSLSHSGSRSWWGFWARPLAS